MPLVTVIVPNFNHAAFLEKRLETIFGQTYRDFEVILLDDCSTDESRGVLKAWCSREQVSHLVFNEKNSGSAFAQWKKGISLAAGKYIWIAESDDFCDPEFLEKAVAKLEAGADVFSVKTLNTGENGELLAARNSWMDDISPSRWDADFESDGPEEVRFALAVKNTIPNASGVVFRMNSRVLPVLARLENMQFCGDWLFWMNLLESPSRYCYCASVRNYFRTHAAVTRKAAKHEIRNREISAVLRFVLALALPAERRRYLVNYYFQNHYFIFPKMSLRKNLRLFMQQMSVSFRFFPLWVNYYFGNHRPR